MISDADANRLPFGSLIINATNKAIATINKMIGASGYPHVLYGLGKSGSRFLRMKSEQTNKIFAATA
jgi:hypothetical protein